MPTRRLDEWGARSVTGVALPGTCVPGAEILACPRSVFTGSTEPSGLVPGPVEADDRVLHHVVAHLHRVLAVELDPLLLDDGSVVEAIPAPDPHPRGEAGRVELDPH